jgi:apolipoprotein N-acyltransferase
VRGSLARPARYGALLSGGLAVLVFPAANLEWLAWVALVPGLVLIQRSPSAREAVVRGSWLGAGYLLAGLWWLTPEIGPALPLTAIAFGPLWAGVAIATWALLRPPVTVARALAALVVVPSAWVVIELIRSWQALGGPWALLGASQWRHPAVLALASVGGVRLISAVLVAANTGLAIVLSARRTAVRALGATAAAACAVSGPVAYALTTAPATARTVTLALVQPGVVHDPKVRVDASQRLTGRFVGGRWSSSRPDLIVWGESSVAYNLNTHPFLLGQLRSLSARAGAEILVNQDAPRGGGHISKVATLVAPAGIEGTYVKTRLVPFGEYIPFRWVLGWLSNVSRASRSNRVPGSGVRLLHVTTPAGQRLPAGVLICFESAFPDVSRVAADKGAPLIIYQSATSTFQDTWAPEQHASLSALRAAETGRPVAQAALTGVSVAFDSRGRELAWLGTSENGAVVVKLALPPASYRTIYDRLGEYVPFTAVGVSLAAGLAGLAGLARLRRNRQAPSRPAAGAPVPAAPAGEPSRRPGGEHGQRTGPRGPQAGLGP